MVKDSLSENSMNESKLSDECLAELLTLNVEVNEGGSTIYRNHLGQKHRVHGPAVIHTDGTTSWWLNGKRHRDHGPAVIWAGGSKSWYQNGLLHRTDGTAIHSESFTEKEYNERIKSI